MNVFIFESVLFECKFYKCGSRVFCIYFSIFETGIMGGLTFVDYPNYPRKVQDSAREIQCLSCRKAHWMISVGRIGHGMYRTKCGTKMGVKSGREKRIELE
jgi:hypothetical protein